MHPVRRTPLIDLLLSLFDSAELLAFLARRPGGPQLLQRLPAASVSLLELVTAAVDLLARHGHVQPPLFAALAETFPLRRPDIDRVAAIFAAPEPVTVEPDHRLVDYADPASLFEGDDP